MNREQAKEILMLYRPETADANDADFCEALRLCKCDPGLQDWFDEHCALYSALQAKFKAVPVPEGLKEQILSERKVHTRPLWRRPAVLITGTATLAVLMVLISLGLFQREPSEGLGFENYRIRMTSRARRTYAMELETDNLDSIRAFLAQRSANAGYVLPTGLQQKAQPTGCARLSWQDQTVSMLCFKSGKPLPPGQSSDLWFLVIERGTMPGAPSSSVPSIADVNGAATASWGDARNVYILIADGSEEFLRSYL